MKVLLRAIVLGTLLHCGFIHAQTPPAPNPCVPINLIVDIDRSATFNGKDSPFIEIVVDQTQAIPDPKLGADPESFEIKEDPKQTFEPGRIVTVKRGIVLFGNYKSGKTYTITVLRDIPCYHPTSKMRAGQIPAGQVLAPVTWPRDKQANTGLERKRVAEFAPSQLTNTTANGKSSSADFDFKLGLTEYIGDNSYIDVATNGNVSPQKDLSFNQIEGHLNYGYRFRGGKTRFELTNTFESTQEGDQVNYVLGGQAVFLPPWAISMFSNRFAWDPTVKLGYQWAKEVAAGVGDTEDSTNRLTYGLHWVVPIAKVYAVVVDSEGILDLEPPIKKSDFHDKTTVGFHVLIHEKDTTKVETVFKYMRGEAAPSFKFNQSLLLGLLLQLR